MELLTLIWKPFTISSVSSLLTVFRAHRYTRLTTWFGILIICSICVTCSFDILGREMTAVKYPWILQTCDIPSLNYCICFNLLKTSTTILSYRCKTFNSIIPWVWSSKLTLSTISFRNVWRLMWRIFKCGSWRKGYQWEACVRVSWVLSHKRNQRFIAISAILDMVEETPL